jgi:hypothetical protein
MLRIEGEWVVLKGITSARIFKKKQIPYEVETGSSIDFLLK